MVKYHQPRSQGSLKKSAFKAIRASISFVGRTTAIVSFLHRKTSPEARHEAFQPPFKNSSFSSATSTSTTPTAASLPLSDCETRFAVPNREAVKDISIQDAHVALSDEAKLEIKQIYDSAGVLDSDLECTTAPEKYRTLDTCDIHVDRSVSRADSGLDLQSTSGPASTGNKDGKSTQASKMDKARKWGKRIKASFLKFSRNKAIADPNTTSIYIAEIASELKDKETNQEDDKDDEDDDDEDVCDQYPRCEFDVIEAIRDIRFQTLVRSKCSFILPSDNVVLVHRTKGAWNFVAMVDIVRDGETIQKYVVRVPGHGTTFHWTQEDAYMMDREVQLIDHIRKKTSVPVPEIIEFDSTPNNTLGYPYILMHKLPGNHAGNIWFDQPYRPTKANYAYRTADVPAISTEKKRINFLRSLARHMTSIQSLSFDKIGMLEVLEHDSQPTVGPHYHWKNDGSDEAVERVAADSTQAYALEAMSKKFKQPEDPELDGAYYKARGNQIIFDIIFSQAVFRPSEPETFTIHHSDLDFQNILVDEDGNVTGIIDWDASYTAPRCIGAAAVPVFLRNDWFPRYVHDIRLTPHMAWNYQHYREVYAAAMFEAGNPDAHFTLNSALYQSVFAAVTEFGDRYSLVEKLLPELPDCRVDARDFQIGLGLGWPAAEEMLKEELPKIFESKLPRPGLLAQLDTEIALREWWLNFDTYLAQDENEPEDGEPDAAKDGHRRPQPTSKATVD